MRLARIRLSNFRSFGPEPTAIDLSDMTFVLGPNGSGKTAVLQALARMFSLDPAQRRVRRSDFNVPASEAITDAPAERSLWIEADFEFPELDTDNPPAAGHPGVPGSFDHMQLAAEHGPAIVRFRLGATLDQDDYIDESFNFVVSANANGEPVEVSRVAKQDRNAIQVHYLPARRDPTDHIAYSATALLGRALRSANWANQRASISSLTDQIGEALESNAAVTSIADALDANWSRVHKGTHFSSPSVSFGRNEIENLLRHLSVSFAPGHAEDLVDFTRLSDGQQSLLYISLVLAMQDIGRRVLAGELSEAFDIDKLRPAVFTLLAIEEPENSLSPHYLGRVARALTTFSTVDDCQAIVATHSPSLLRRVPPEAIRYLRLGEARTTAVSRVTLPDDPVAEKFIREGVQSFPELYFSRLVILGEGDSEQLVLPRLLAARGILLDDASISVVPLGGRHVNHMWRLLNGLGIPHVTLLDLDVARYQAGWGRIRYAAQQLIQHASSGNDITPSQVQTIPAWDAEDRLLEDDLGWIDRLESFGVFFTTPLDLDFMMLTCFPDAYAVDPANLRAPDDAAVISVLGKGHDTVNDQYEADELQYFGYYRARFKSASKPSSHINALAQISDDELLDGIPAVLDRFFDMIEAKLASLPE